jgi:hypothetical protein
LIAEMARITLLKLNPTQKAEAKNHEAVIRSGQELPFSLAIRQHEAKIVAPAPGPTQTPAPESTQKPDRYIQ